MSEHYSLIIRNGSIVDGDGAPRFRADIAIRGGRIAAIGPSIQATAEQEIDAAGKIVTPGFIDGHTHFDAQAVWDAVIEPSASHGVTTAVMGNCGVGFAPVREVDRGRIIGLMEDVEDIPGTALHEGIRWEWETFPEYLDALGRQAYAIDLAAQVPHAPLRLYVMGDRGARDEPATNDDLEVMAALVKEGLEAGAVGFSTSRVLEHRSLSGQPISGTFASEDEIMALAGAIREAGRGVLQVVPQGVTGGSAFSESAGRLAGEIDLLARIALNTGVPIVFSLLMAHDEPDAWRAAVATACEVNEAGGNMKAMVGPRSPGTLSSWAAYHIFTHRPTYMKIANLPIEERLVELRKLEIRRAILSEKDAPPQSESLTGTFHLLLRRTIGDSYVYDGRQDFEPDLAEASLRKIAENRGHTLEECVYDSMLQEDGHAQISRVPINYARGSYDEVKEILEHPSTIVGLSDAGAHVRVICDAANPTFMLTFWSRDRVRGPKFSLEQVVKMNTSDLADVFGFDDRGRLRVGLRADINVIDFDNLKLGLPYVAADLPTGGQRLLQGASGYDATLVNGVVVRRHGKPTGAHPGRLIRGAGVHKSAAKMRKLAIDTHR